MSLRAKWAAALFVIIYFCFRLSVLSSGYTHVDDIGPLILLLQGHELGLSGLWHGLRIWTYAPGPYVFSYPLLELVRSPEGALFAARGVSLLGWAVGLALVWQLMESLRRIFAPAWPRLLSAGLVFWALASWRGTVESGQSYNYAWTLAVAALMLGYLLSRLAAPAVSFDAGRGLRDGLILGLGMAFSYQAMFVAAAVFGALAFMRWRGVDREAWKEEAVALLGFGFCVWLAQHFHIRHLQMLPRHPPWAAGYPPEGASLPAALASLVQGAWGAAQNVLAVAPWGPWSAGLSGLALLLAAMGMSAKAASPVQRKVKAGLLLCGAGLLLIWSAGAWTLRFPFGPTRHTFILQLPLLVVLGLGFKGLPSRLVQAFFLSLAAIWIAWFPTILANTRGKVDLRRIESLLDQHPEAMAIEPKLSATRDQMLLWRSRPDLRPRIYCDEMGDLILGPHAPAALIMATHGGPLSPEAQALLAQGGYTYATLEAIPPQAPWELAGYLDGGNGFYLYFAQKGRKKP